MAHIDLLQVPKQVSWNACISGRGAAISERGAGGGGEVVFVSVLLSP